MIPEDLLPCLPSDFKKLFENCVENVADNSIQGLYEGIMAGETVEQIIPKIGKYIYGVVCFYL